MPTLGLCLPHVCRCQKRADCPPKTCSLGTGIEHCRWCFTNCRLEEMPSTWENSDGLGECWFGKGQEFGRSFFCEEDILEYWWQKYLLSELLHYCMASDQGAPQEGTRSVLWKSRNVTVFSDGIAVPLSLASPTSLCCLERLSWWGRYSPCSASCTAVHLGPMLSGGGAVICTHDLKFWVPFICITGAQPKLRPHFISIGQTKTIPTSILFTV